MRIVFVCTGNLCRSPMAEGLLRAWLARHGGEAVTVSSMGTLRLRPQPPAAEAQAVCAERNVDISAQRSRGLLPEELASAAHVFTMDLLQREEVLTACPACRDRVHLLGSWPRPERVEDAVPDPMGQPVETYRRACALIKRHIQRIGPLLVSEAQAQSARCQPPST